MTECQNPKVTFLLCCRVIRIFLRDFCSTSFNSFLCSSVLCDEQFLLQCTNYEQRLLQILCVLDVNLRGTGNLTCNSLSHPYGGQYKQL